MMSVTKNTDELETLWERTELGGKIDVSHNSVSVFPIYSVMLYSARINLLVIITIQLSR